MYTVPIQVGPSGQTVDLQVDTGSSDLVSRALFRLARLTHRSLELVSSGLHQLHVALRLANNPEPAYTTPRSPFPPDKRFKSSMSKAMYLVLSSGIWSR